MIRIRCKGCGYVVAEIVIDRKTKASKTLIYTKNKTLEYQGSLIPLEILAKIEFCPRCGRLFSKKKYEVIIRGNYEIKRVVEF
jgi:rubredoxin